MKSVLISIQPQWCELIAAGKKILEVRKTRPKLETPFKCYIYCTKSDGMFWVLNTISRVKYGFPAVCANLKNDELAIRGDGKVIGEFICDNIITPFSYSRFWVSDHIVNESCLSPHDIRKYANGGNVYGWHISNLKIYDKPKPLSDFKPWKRKCKFSDLGYAIPNCKECHECKIERPPQSWCYVEEM